MSNSTAVLTYTTVGNREDLLDVITNISPTETPMFSSFGKSKATSTHHEWLTDSLATATANAHVEGADYTFVRPAARSREGNYTQIFQTLVEVSDTQRAVDSAGIEDEYSYQLAKGLKEHARDIEYALVNGTGNSGASGTARELKGVLAFISTNITTGSATGLALNEEIFNDCLQSIWTSGGKPNVAFANGFQKRKISSFSTPNTRFQSGEDKEIIAGVDVYDSDFGRIKIVADRYMPAAQVAILQSDLWKVATLRPTKTIDVAKVGSATRGVIESELTLESRNEKGSGKITGMKTSA